LAKGAKKPLRDDAPLTAQEARRRLRGRNLALLGVLGGLAVLFYVLAIVRLAIR